MKLILLPIDCGQSYDQLEIQSSITHQAIQWVRESTILAEVKRIEAELKALIAAGQELPSSVRPVVEDNEKKYVLPQIIYVLFNSETGEPIPYNSPMLAKGFEVYSALPKASRAGRVDLYPNWCVTTGRSFMHPHPHRHYTSMEFYHKLGSDSEFAQRFLNLTPAPNGAIDNEN